MENINIPLFRAKKLNSNEYVIGNYNQYIQNGKVYHCIMIVGSYPSPFDNTFLIDIETLSILFNDMVDTQGNKIFASLNKDGKGGDICYVYDFSYGDLQGIAKYKNHSFVIDRKGKSMGISFTSKDIKVIGIQE